VHFICLVRHTRKKWEIEDQARVCPEVSGNRFYGFPLVNVVERLKFRNELKPFKG